MNDGEASSSGQDGRPLAVESTSVLGSSAVMATGTVVSRLSGYLRTTLLAAALGAQLHADLFTIGNTIPNMLYILLAGGIFNAVLVPQLVRAMKNDADGGDAYTNRIVTLAALFLGVVTVLLVAGAPLVMQLYLDSSFNDPSLAEQRESVIDFARYCLPQVFFYGMFVLVGQVLNARGRFGPMMWAPIANNVIAVLVLVIYLFVFGPAAGSQLTGGYQPSQEALLGIGSTLGIAVQFAILLPFLRAAGFRYRPRFDFRGTGLGRTLRLGGWTLGYVIVNQVAYTVVVRLASGGTAAAAESGTDAAGYTVYSATFLIMMVPHSVITVSLATAVLPRLSARAAEADLRGLAAGIASTLRTALAFILPFAMLLPVLAPDLANVILGYGAARDDVDLYVPALSLFAPGLVFFTVHYLMLRGLYALERTRTAFWIQCCIAATNIGVAVTLTSLADPRRTVPALVIAYGTAYLVGSAISFTVLRHHLGGLEVRRLVRFVVRVGIAGVLSTAVGLGASRLLHLPLEPQPHQAIAGLAAVAVTLVDVAAFVLLSRALRIDEVGEVVALVTRRLPGARRLGAKR